MRSGLPPEIDVITTPRGERYVMPTRRVGCLRVAAVPMLLIGLVFLFVGCYTSVVEGGLWHWANGTTGKPVDLYNIAFGLPFIAIGYGMLYLGAMMLGGRSVIELRDETLIATQRSGPFRWRRKIPLSEVARLQIKSSNIEEATVAIGAAMSALNVVRPDGGLYSLAWGYPKPMLRALADDLSAKFKSAGGARLVNDSPGGGGIEVEVTTLGADRLADKIKQARSDADDPGEQVVPQKPTGSEVRVEPRDDGVTIIVPPVGMRKGGKGMFGFSIVWNGFMLIVTTAFFFGGNKSVQDLLIILGVLGLFWVVGIWMLVATINAGRRTAILDVVGDTLLITRQNIFGTKQQEITRDNIKSICRDKSGVEVNDEPILNLQIRLHEGKKISMFSQLADNELSWLAAVLREALGLNDNEPRP